MFASIRTRVSQRRHPEVRGSTLEQLESRSLMATTLNWSAVKDPGVGGWVTSIEVSPHDSNRVLAGGDMLGIALSTDGGSTWQDTFGLNGVAQVEEFTFSPSSATANTVWAGTAAGPYKSTDGGKNWTLKRAGMGTSGIVAVQKIVYDPDNSSRLLAFVGNHRHFSYPYGYAELGKVYVSTDGGENWTALSTIASGSHINTAIYRPGSNSVVYAATDDGFYRSDNDGASWTKKTAGLPSGGISWVTASTTSGGTLWCSVGGSGIYKSTDGGDNWTATNSGLSVGGGHFDVVEAAPSNPDVLITANEGWKHLYKSTNGGASWTEMTSFGPTAYPNYKDVHAVAFRPSDANTIYLTTPVQIWRTTNGTDWTDVTSTSSGGKAFVGTGFSGQVPWGYKFNPYNVNESMLLAMDSGKWVSRDDMKTWVFGGAGRYTGLDDWFGAKDVAFTKSSGTMYVAQGQGWQSAILKTTDGGAHWTTTSAPTGVSGDPDLVYAHPDDPARVWVVWSGNIYYSSNSGTNWTEVATNTGWVKAMVADPNNHTTIWVGSDTGLWKTADGSAFSQVTGTNSGAARGVTKLKIDPSNASRVYLINRDYANTNTWDTGLWKYESGVFMNLTNDGDYGKVRQGVDVAIDPKNPQRLVLATNEDPWRVPTYETGIWVSEDGGGSWAQQNNGLPMLRVKTIEFKPDGSRLVAGLNGRGYYKVDFASDVPGGSGSISQEIWTGVSGTSVSSIPVNTTPSSTATLTSFETPTNTMDNYGVRVRGYLTAPATGGYTFWIASDDSGELWLSADSSPSNKQRIASVSGWTNSREWSKYASQKSVVISLTAGQRYYIEALMKEGSGGDNLAVGWAKPGQATTAPSEVIPGSALSPYVNGGGSVTEEIWTGVPGTSVANIPTSTTPNQTATLTSLEIPSNTADNYGVRIRGYLTPASSGTYYFWISGDDNSEFYLSTNDQPANKSRRCYVSSWTSSREWGKEANQKSASIALTAGTKYYFEVLMKEGGGGDNLAIAWSTSSTTPTNGDGSKIITGSVLSPYAANTAAKLTGTVIGTTGSWSNSGNTRDKVFDGSLSTFFDAPDANANNAWVGLDLGSGKTITSIKYAPRSGFESRMTNGYFQVSNTADFSTAITIYTVTASPAANVLTTQSVNVSGTWRYVRFVSPTGGYGNIAEMEVWGY